MVSKAGDGYHHGNLPTALKEAAVELIGAKGPAGFSLREVARRAGVSHAAPAHHFRDATGLLTAIAIDAFKLLDAALAESAVGATDTRDRLRRCGRAYVETGIAHPAHLDLVFRPDLVDTDSPEYKEWGERTYGRLVATLEALRDDGNPDLDVENGARLCWSMVQGLVVLFPGMSGREMHHGGPSLDIGDLAARFSDLLLDGLLAR